MIVFLDRTVRYARVFFIHMNWAFSERGPFGFRSFEGTISRHYDAEDNIDALVLRLPKATVKYSAGQHFFLTFPTMSPLSHIHLRLLAPGATRRLGYFMSNYTSFVSVMDRRNIWPSTARTQGWSIPCLRYALARTGARMCSMRAPRMSS